MTKPELLIILAKLVHTRKATFIRRMSNRFKIHSVPAKNGGTIYFIYDRHKNVVTDTIPEDKATFKVDETVVIYNDRTGKVYKAKIICILPPGKSPIDVVDMFPDHKDDRIFQVNRYNIVNSYILKSGNRLFWYSLRTLRKIDEVKP